MSLGVEVRDGQVEESECAEGDDLGLRVLVGRRQAMVSTNDLADHDATALAERAIAMARVTPRTSSLVSPTQTSWREIFLTSI